MILDLCLRIPSMSNIATPWTSLSPGPRSVLDLAQYGITTTSFSFDPKAGHAVGDADSNGNDSPVLRVVFLRLEYMWV